MGQDKAGWDGTGRDGTGQGGLPQSSGSACRHHARLHTQPQSRRRGRQTAECSVPGRSSPSRGESLAEPRGAQMCPLHLHPGHAGSPSLHARALPSLLRGAAPAATNAQALTRARDTLLCHGQATLQTCPQRRPSLVLWHRTVGKAGQRERALAAGTEGCCGQTRRAVAPQPPWLAGSHPGSPPR